MLVDLHAHTSGISRCCRVPAPQVLQHAQAAGLDGIVLTNHYTKYYIDDGDAKGFAQRYMQEYAYTAQEADKMGMKVFFGIEVSTELYAGVHMLVYGVGQDFLLAYPELFDLPQQQLYELVKENGGTLIQAHPYRGGTTVLDTRYLDGVEINCHPLYKTSEKKRVLQAAQGTGLIVTCGGDYHADTYRAHCGVYLPDAIATDEELGEYLRTASSINLCVHEPDTPASYDMVYTRM